MLRGRVRRVHFVGIGGSGMSGIAEVLLDQGYEVTGSDMAKTAATQRLQSLGARCAVGHAAANAVGADVVVTSSAIPAGNPEVAEALGRGIPVIPRAEMLAELMRVKYGVAVGGSHGKTTTTSLIAAVLTAGGLDPTVVVGGRLGARGSGGQSGRGDFLVAEADESDRSFLKLTPTIAVITNIDREHLEAYGDMDSLQQAFIGFANRVPFYGAAVVCTDDARVREIVPELERRTITYGLDEGAAVSARDVSLFPASSRFVASRNGQPLGAVQLPVPGAHNVTNALAAIAVGLELGASFAEVTAGLEAFAGVERRFQARGGAGGITLIDDYGHHPTEIRAVLETLHCAAQGRRTVVLFQPHRFSRTRALWPEFSTAFGRADRVLLVDVFAAGEESLPNVTSRALAEEIAQTGTEATYAGDLDAATAELEALVRPGDVVLTLGAGDVWKAGQRLLDSLQPGGAR